MNILLNIFLEFLVQLTYRKTIASDNVFGVRQNQPRQRIWKIL